MSEAMSVMELEPVGARKSASGKTRSSTMKTELKGQALASVAQ